MHVSSLITVEFVLFIKSQFTINIQNILNLNQGLMDWSDYGMSHNFKGFGEVANCLTVIKNVFVKSLFTAE